MKLQKQYPGFTFLELLMAIVLMGVMLSLTTSVVISTIRFYTFSNTIRQNQQDSRNIMDLLSREIRNGLLIYPDGNTAPSSTLCIAFPRDQKVIKYEVSNNELTEYSSDYLAGTTPGCSGGMLVSKKFNNPAKLKVTKLEVEKIQGAPIITNSNSPSVVIRLTSFSGSPVSQSGNLVCQTRDIYCNKLIYTTAINLKADN